MPLKPSGPRSRHSRRTLALLLSPLVLLSIGGVVANAFFPALLEKHPLALLMLDARNRQLVLVANKVDPTWFFLVGTARRLLSDPIYYLLGRYYGDGAVRWVERKLGDDLGLVRGIERVFARGGPLLVFAFPGALICVLAGATRMAPPLFLGLNLIGTILVVWLFFEFGEVFEVPVTSVTEFIGRNYRWLTVLTLVVTLWWVWDQRRRGRSELETVSTLERELEDATARAETEPDGEAGPTER